MATVQEEDSILPGTAHLPKKKPSLKNRGGEEGVGLEKSTLARETSKPEKLQINFTDILYCKLSAQKCQ